MLNALATDLTHSATHGNPRQIKRFLNSMMLRHAIAEERGFGDDIKRTVLGKMMLAERFYPDFYKQLAQLATSEGGKPKALAQFEQSLKNDGIPSTASETSPRLVRPNFLSSLPSNCASFFSIL